MGEFYAFCLEFYELSTNQSECKWQSGMAVDKVWHCKVSGPGICVLHPNPNFDPDPRDHKMPHLPRPSSIQKKCIIFFFFLFFWKENANISCHTFCFSALPANYDFREQAVNI